MLPKLTSFSDTAHLETSDGCGATHVETVRDLGSIAALGSIQHGGEQSSSEAGTKNEFGVVLALAVDQ